RCSLFFVVALPSFLASFSLVIRPLPRSPLFPYTTLFRSRQDSSGPALLRILLCQYNLRLQGFHLLWLTFPNNSASLILYNIVVLQPHKSTLLWFGLFPFRSPLLGESFLFSFPPGT